MFWQAVIAATDVAVAASKATAIVLLRPIITVRWVVQ
jgi:hypothetical protein